jgi:hypothetical protein
VLSDVEQGRIVAANEVEDIAAGPLGNAGADGAELLAQLVPVVDLVAIAALAQ